MTKTAEEQAYIYGETLTHEQYSGAVLEDIQDWLSLAWLNGHAAGFKDAMEPSAKMLEALTTNVCFWMADPTNESTGRCLKAIDDAVEAFRLAKGEDGEK